MCAAFDFACTRTTTGTYEAITHYGLAIKSIINEMCGDGIMSAIDFYMDVGTTTGKLGEKRVVITFVRMRARARTRARCSQGCGISACLLFTLLSAPCLTRSLLMAQNGKFLPFIEQLAENNGAPSPRD